MEKDIYEGVIIINTTGGLPNSALLELRKDEVLSRVVDCADICCNMELDTVPICEIDDNYIDFFFKNYKTDLEKCTKHFLEVENYEMCRRISDLIERIETTYKF